MATNPEAIDFPHLDGSASHDQVIKLLTAYEPLGLSEHELDAFKSFLGTLYAKIPSEELASVPVDQLRAQAESFWAYSKTRTVHPDFSFPSIRIFNPDRQENGWDGPHTVLEIISDDMPFIVASILAELTEHKLAIDFLAHPIFNVRRDDAGARLQIEPIAMSHVASDDMHRESMIHAQLSERLSEDEMVSLQDSVAQVMAHIGLAVDDWKSMDSRLQTTIQEMSASAAHIPADEHFEAVEFLKWLCDDHFLFFGARDYSFEGDPETGRLEPVIGSDLGVLKDPAVKVLRNESNDDGSMSPEVRAFLATPVPIIVTKSNFRSRLHRRVHMDYIGVKLFGTNGRLIGERRFVGLFTSAAYTRSTRSIPFIRRKVQLTLAKSGLDLAGHDETALLNIIETYPRDELFQIDVETLAKTCNGILRLNERPRAKVFIRHDQFKRFISAIIFFPRERFSSAMREKVGAILADMYGGRISAFYTQFGDQPLSRVHFIIGRINPDSIPSDITVEKRVVEAVRSWHDRLSDTLKTSFGLDIGSAMARRYEGAFTEAYKEAFNAHDAALDIGIMEQLSPNNPCAVRTYREKKDPKHGLRLKLYHEGEAITLTESMPMLENLGLKVVYEFAYDAHPTGPDATNLWIHDFYMETPDETPIKIGKDAIMLESAILAVLEGDAENDGFNRLTIDPGAHWRDVAILRALAKYRQQIGTAFSQAYIEEALAENPHLVQKLIELFKIRFEPDLPGTVENRESAADEIRQSILRNLEQVQSLDQDRIIRRLLNLIDSALRTNFFQTNDDGASKAYISIKFDARNVEEMPEPKPFAEIFVYSPQVEGVHLRAGPVARGGLRWSDRREDFRTEVLGLVKAQQVKNAVIVPSGAKGGFFPKALPVTEDRGAIRDAAIEAYKAFISGLLDITDNLPLGGTEGDVIPPQGVVRHDGDDPYLVVAADKGTATFSDIANGVAEDYGFWLGDGFASGGSAGYDHKAMGITARGAWEAVKRHFREIGTDIQTEPFNVIGVGDMSGDVFGNGMLLSKAIRLIAAFDHRHIFIDPDPDPAKSWTERARIFELPRSSWEDYAPELISEGGGIFSRSAKSIMLTPQIKELFDIAEDSVPPNELLTAILKARSDLLWFGGIGTYIKSSDETHLDVGDHANDTIRINADELQVRVIGEGANLGVTQLGRIEFANEGGKVNMDAFDNAAGVDCSDHEVNIKILISSALASGALGQSERLALLESMTDDVSDLVLKNNYRQTLSLTITEWTAAADRDAHGRMMNYLEREGRLEREIEFLPDEERLQQLAESRKGMSRPELAVLMSYTKIALFDALLPSNLMDDPFFEVPLHHYFPQVLQDRFGDLIDKHRLRREIIATELANDMIDVGGLTYVHRLNEITGASVTAIAKAFVISAGLFDTPNIRNQINAQDNILSADAQTAMHHQLQTVIRKLTTWFLRHKPTGDISSILSHYRPGFEALVNAPRTLTSAFEQEAINERIKELTDFGVAGELADRMATLETLTFACDLIDLSEQVELPLADVAQAYFHLGENLGLDQLIARADKLSAGEHWDRLAIKRITGDFMQYQRQLSKLALSNGTAPSDEPAMARLERWFATHEEQLGSFQHFLGQLESAGGLTIAKLTLAGSQLRDLVQMIERHSARQSEQKA